MRVFLLQIAVHVVISRVERIHVRLARTETGQGDYGARSVGLDVVSLLAEKKMPFQLTHTNIVI